MSQTVTASSVLASCVDYDMLFELSEPLINLILIQLHIVMCTPIYSFFLVIIPIFAVPVAFLTPVPLLLSFSLIVGS